MLRRHFLWSSACMLVGCGAQGVEQQKQKICSRPAVFGAYNIYDKWGKTHLTYHMSKDVAVRPPNYSILLMTFFKVLHLF